LTGKRELSKVTSGNKHSEMGVLGDGLKNESLTITEDGMMVVESDGRALTLKEFETTTNSTPPKEMDHCGYCTYFLTLMDVPTGRPTFQPSKFAGGQQGSKIPYVLPDLIREHPAIIAKVLGFENGNQFVNETKEGIEAFYEQKKTQRINDKTELEKFVELKET